jgi:hypothetical protein
MKTKPFVRYVAIPLIYVAALMGIVIVQFSRNPRFFETVGELRLSGFSERGEEAVAALSIAGPGFEMDFGRASLASRDASGSARAHRLEGWRREGESAIVVSFEGPLSILMRSEGGGKVEIRVAESPKGVVGIELPLRFLGNVSKDDDGLWRMPYGGAFLALSPGPRNEYDSGASVLRLAANAKGFQPSGLSVQAQRASAGLARFDRLEALDPQSIERAVGAFVDKAWAGWSTARLSVRMGGWAGADGSYEFTESALLAYLAEAMRRGGWQAFSDARDGLSEAIKANQARLTWVSSPLLGGTVPRDEARRASDGALAAKVQGLIAARDPAAFAEEGLIELAYDKFPLSLSPALASFASSYDGEGASVEQAVGMLECAVRSAAYLPRGSNPFERYLAAAETLIIPSVKEVAGKLYLLDSEGVANARLQLRAGLLLASASALPGYKQAFGAVGQALVLAVLEKADANGFIPASFALSAAGAAPSLAALVPEAAYPLVTSNPYFPRLVSFYKELGPGVWAWTSARSLDVDSAPGRVVFGAEYFHPGASHYLIIHGLKQFEKIQLYNIDFRTDPNFERYESSGWAFSSKDGTLYLKMRHRNERELARLFY